LFVEARADETPELDDEPPASAEDGHEKGDLHVAGEDFDRAGGLELWLEAGFDEGAPDGDGEKGQNGSAEDKRDDEKRDQPENRDEEALSEFFEVIAQRHGRVFENAELIEWAWDWAVLGVCGANGLGVVGITGRLSQRLCPNLDGAASWAHLVGQRQRRRAVGWMSEI